MLTTEDPSISTQIAYVVADESPTHAEAELLLEKLKPLKISESMVLYDLISNTPEKPETTQIWNEKLDSMKLDEKEKMLVTNALTSLVDPTLNGIKAFKDGEEGRWTMQMARENLKDPKKCAFDNLSEGSLNFQILLKLLS